MSPRIPSLIAAAALLLAGCAGYDFAALEGAEDGVPDEFLRVDVYPSDRNADLLPQSHWVDGWFYAGGEAEITMSGTVDIEGKVEGALLTDGGSDNARARSVPVEANIDAWIEGTVMAASTVSDKGTGAYAFNLAPRDGYVVAVVPEDGSPMPFAVHSDQNIVNDRSDWILLLDDGARVRGQVLDGDGTPRPGLQVRAVHTETGVAGPAVTTRSDGSYSLHLAPDSYTIEFGGEAGDLVPTTSVGLEAVDNETAILDLELGSLAPLPASGRVVNADSNRPVEGAQIRLWSEALEHHPDARLERTAVTDQAGFWEADVLPGVWQVELTPPAEAELTPTRTSFTARDDEASIDFGATGLLPCIEVQTWVMAPSGLPASGVTVVASEQDITDRTYTGTSDNSGLVILTLPQSPLHVVLTPSEASAAVTHLDVEGEAFPETLELIEGRLMTGRIMHDGQPVQAALVEVRHGDSEALYATTFTDSDGSFELRLATNDEDLAVPADTDADSWDTGYLD